MADSTPLLPRFNPSESSTHSLPKGFNSLDDTIEQCIGNSGLTQFLQAFLASFAWAFDAQQTFISVFTDKNPSWHCVDSGDILCSSAVNPCRIPASAWTWDEPAHASIISEWNLECSGEFIAGLPASAFFAGCLAGGLLATLADSSLGRKKMLLLSCLIMSLTGILTVFSPNVWVYSFLRFITGFGRAAIGTCAMVLSTEIVGKRWRDKVGTIGFFCFTLGFLSLPIMRYLARESSWRTLYLWTSIPTLCYCLAIYLFVNESPRWLFVLGRTNEAIQTLKNISSSNGKKLDFNFSQVSINVETPNVDIYVAMKILWEKKWAFRRLLVMMVVGYGVGLVYYGIPLAVGNLNFNLYLSVTFNALAELPAALITLFLIGILNRRSLILIFTLMSGACSLLCVFMGESDRKWVQMGSEVVSFLGACTAFNVVIIYTIELFPTCVRNSALSMVRQAFVLGGIFSPMLVVAGRKEGFLSFGVFGLVIASCGLFVIWLPETRGGAFCDTIEEQETKEIASSDYVC
ncbi:organic cation/carnitine transporter 3 [Tasmannia lanceolata]|uniref:organic cation/carnitine transporter 3 n=1 Tax=Tasmannia lanceolata TaxID=3420 RepID=UPI004062CBEC